MTYCCSAGGTTVEEAAAVRCARRLQRSPRFRCRVARVRNAEAGWKSQFDQGIRTTTFRFRAAVPIQVSFLRDGKKPQRHDWPEVKKLCRLNQDESKLAKRLGFGRTV